MDDIITTVKAQPKSQVIIAPSPEDKFEVYLAGDEMTKDIAIIVDEETLRDIGTAANLFVECLDHPNPKDLPDRTKISDHVRRFLCKKLGHRWIYFKNGSDLRFCERCHRAQTWKVITNEHKFWTYVVQYRTFGAKNHVEGYGK